MLYRLPAGLALACIFLAAPALAQATVEPTTVTLPWGEWVNEIAEIARNVALTAVPLLLAWAAKDVPWWASQWLKTKAAEQLLARAIDAGYNKVRGATKDQTLTLDTGSAVLAQAANYAMEHGSAALKEWLGGRQGIEDRILARLNLGPNTVLPPSDR